MQKLNPLKIFSDYMRDLKKFRSETRLLMIGILLSAAGSGMVLPFLTIYFHSEIGISYTIAGLLIGLRAGVSLGSKIVSGWSSDNFGRKKTLQISLVLMTVSYIGYAISADLTGLMITVSLQGFGVGLFWPSSQSYISDIEDKMKEKAFAVQRAFRNGGKAFGIFLGGFIATFSYEILFYGDALMTLGFLVIAIFKLPESISSTAKATSYNYRSIINDLELWKLFFIHTLFIILISQLFNMVPPFLRETGSYSEYLIGNLFLINAGIVFLYQLSVTDYIEKYDFRQVCLVSFSLWTLTSLSFLSYQFVGLASIALSLILIAVSQMVFIPKASNLMSELAAESETGLYMAMISVSWSLGFILGPAIGGRLLELQPNLIWYFTGLVSVSGVSCALMFYTEYDRVLEKVPDNWAGK